MLAQRLEASAAALPQLQARLAELKAGASARDIALDGNSDAVAAANLQSRLEKLASSTGAAIGSSEAIPAESRGAFRRIGLRLAINGPYAAIVNLLGAIDNSTPPLVSSNLQIHAMVRPMAGDPGNARLDAAVEVYGFRAVDAAPPTQQ
jgi:general secretion pathway protein M